MKSPTKLPTFGKSDWQAMKVRIAKDLSESDRQILELLAQGNSTPVIARLLGTNRSAIWRRVQRLKIESENAQGGSSSDGPICS